MVDKMRELEKFFKALSDLGRLRILNLFFYTDKLYPCEIENILNMSQTRISRNLNILLDAGFLKHKREGKYVCYSLIDNFDKGLANFLKGKLKDFEQIRTDHERLISFKTRKTSMICKNDI